MLNFKVEIEFLKEEKLGSYSDFERNVKEVIMAVEKDIRKYDDYFLFIIDYSHYGKVVVERKLEEHEGTLFLSQSCRKISNAIKNQIKLLKDCGYDEELYIRKDKQEFSNEMKGA